LRRQLQQAVQQSGFVERRHAEALQQRIIMQQQFIQLRRQSLGLRQIGDADGAAGDLILIGRTDAAAGGADLPVTAGFFACFVQGRVQRQDQRGVVGDA
jgi:hypothetical protein